MDHGNFWEWVKYKIQKWVKQLIIKETEMLY